MFGKNRKKKVGLCVMVVTSCFILAGLWAVLATPETALAKKPVKPDPVVLWDAEFIEDGSCGSEIVGSASEVAQSTYRTRFGTGNVVVTLWDGTVLDQKAFLMRFTNDTTGERYLVFRIGLQGGHHKKDRYSTPTPNEGVGIGDTVIPFPETKIQPEDDAPWLEEVRAGSVDANLDMEPGAHVILHLHVSDVPLIRMTGPDAGSVIGTISVGDIEFTFPE